MFKLFSGRNSGNLKMRRPISITDAVFPSSEPQLFEEEKQSFLKKFIEKDVELALVIFIGNAFFWVKTFGVSTPVMALVHVVIFIVTLLFVFWRLEKRSDEDPIKKMVKDFNEFLERLGST